MATSHQYVNGDTEASILNSGVTLIRTLTATEPYCGPQNLWLQLISETTKAGLGEV